MKKRSSYGKRKGAKSFSAASESYRYPIMINPERGLVPLVFRTHFSFVESWDNTTAAPGFYDWVLRGNSIYDPDFALSADSAYGLAAMASLYLNYKVLSSQVTVTVVNNSDADPVNVSIIPSRFSASFDVGNKDGIMVHPRAKKCTVSKLSGGKTISHSASSCSMFNVSDLDSVNFSSEFTTNPASCWYWHVVTWNNAGNASDCEMLLSISYLTDISGIKAYEQ